MKNEINYRRTQQFTIFNLQFTIYNYAKHQSSSFNLAIWWFVLGMVQFMACGTVAAAIYSEKLADEQTQ